MTCMTQRKRYPADFKAKVTSEAIREERTGAELAKKYDTHPTMNSGRKRTAIEYVASAFGGSAAAVPSISDKEVEKPHAKTGHYPARAGLMCRHQLYSYALKAYAPGYHSGLLQPQDIELAAVEFHGYALLRRSPRGGAGQI